MAELIFKAKTHQYFLGKRELPSVTTVLQSVGLIDYSGVDRDVLEYARERGILVHEACRLFDEGDLDEENLDPILKPYVDAWKKFLFHSQFKVERIEVPMCDHTYGFAGTPDRIGMIRGRRTIVDIKPPTHKPWYQLQTAGYSFFVPETLQFRLVVHLRPDGEFRVSEHTNMQDRQRFLACLTVAQLKREFGGNNGNGYRP